MARTTWLVLIVSSLLAGCAGTDRELPSSVRVELPKRTLDADRDLVPLSLRPLPSSGIAKLPKSLDRSGTSLRLSNSKARLQYELPLLPKSASPRLNLLARSYWDPDAIDTPEGRLLLRLRLPLSSVPPLPATSALPAISPPGDLQRMAPATHARCSDAGLARDDGARIASACEKGADIDALVDDWSAGYLLPVQDAG